MMKKRDYRPKIHFSPEEGWMNDPNGMVYVDGVYHFFYQKYPYDTSWGPMHWGHATSRDLIHWEHQPIALYPDELGFIFSGSAVYDTQNSSEYGTNEDVYKRQDLADRFCLLSNVRPDHRLLRF